MTLTELNALDAAGFVAALDGVFEHSPWIAARTHAATPFASIDALHRALIDTVRRASEDERLALLRAHPELAGKGAIAGELTAASTDEQASAGLRACTPEEFARIGELNRRYNARFDFPFILAVRGLDRLRIIETFAQRVGRWRRWRASRACGSTKGSSRARDGIFRAPPGGRVSGHAWPGLPAAATMCSWSCRRYWWTNAMAMLPSPTADATRLTGLKRTSPQAKTPGTLVSSR
jgi:OHCU decarboxylase